MFYKLITTTALAAAIAFTPADEVQADAGDFVAGAIIGGLVGHAATKNAQRRKRTTTRRTYRSTIPRSQAGREIQSGLNYFGFNAGSVDGQLGRRSRVAISNYQAYLGYPATGQLTPFEQNLLISSHNRALAGGYAVSQQIAQNPEGTRGLLKAYRTEMAGGVPTQPVYGTQPATTTIVVAPQVAPQAAEPTTTLALTSTQPQTSSGGLGALPNFLGNGAQVSLASHCNTVSLVTNTNGGFTNASQMNDPSFALNEQFCLARTYAISESERMISAVQGFTPDQIAGQCDAFGPAMKEHVAALSLKTQPEVISGVSSFILSTGMSPAQLTGTAKICLGVGYRTDNMDVAIGSALLLVAMGEGVYSELMGHHLAQGFGTSKRTDTAQVWYNQALGAHSNGATAVFAPGQPERNELIRKASMQLNGGDQASNTPTVQPVSALPTFSVDN